MRLRIHRAISSSSTRLPMISFSLSPLSYSLRDYDIKLIFIMACQAFYQTGRFHFRHAAPLLQRQDLWFAVRNQDGVFIMRGQRTVFCYNGPAVIHPCYILTSCGDHRLNSKCHTGRQADSFAALGKVWYLRLLMHLCADSVANQISYYAEAEAFCICLNGL